MGLTNQSTGLGTLKELYEVELENQDDIIVGLAGNPNTGKSTVFNSLTGLKQHTGNWPGKTVTNAQGRYEHRGKGYVLVDLPGTYSLLSSSLEEEVARDFICFGNAHLIVVVTDATSLQRNLNLVLQILEITDKVVVCVNLMDEARRKKIRVNTKRLEEHLGVPVVGTSARNGIGLPELKDAVARMAAGEIAPRAKQIQYENPVEKAIDMVRAHTDKLGLGDLNSRWVSLRLIEGDAALMDTICKHMENHYGSRDEKIESMGEEINRARLMLGEEGLDQDGLRDSIVSSIVGTAEEIGRDTVYFADREYRKLDYRIDRILTSRAFGIPIMIALLGLIFWITIEGANYPSQLLSKGLFQIEEWLTRLFIKWGTPRWIHGMLILGVYRTLAWVVSVMLPPMAIFFPLFTLLEDLGYLPRIAFNLDSFFKRACAHGKQALTMCMGFGCNAAGIIACRIIDSPRERLIAILTNNFVPCNGRFPLLIALAGIFITGRSGTFKSVVSTLAVLGAVVLGVVITLVISRILSKTILKGLPSSFTLELPPYRRPQVGKILIRSFLDRTLFVLGRAVSVAAPAGLFIWLMANLSVEDVSLLDHGARFLDPFGKLLGMDGYIILAFILGLPANEIVIPIIIMSYMASGAIIELDSLDALRELLVANGWTWLTAVSTMLFSLNHFPCGTTLLTIHKETRSRKWTLLSFAIPTLTGIIVCFTVAQGVRLLGLV
ncbi:MAG: ferrous iron transport protein B [Caldicoprobacterales bacterium]|jgi:ferrous iron transport protein B